MVNAGQGTDWLKVTIPTPSMEIDLSRNIWLKMNGLEVVFINKEGGCYVYGSKQH